MVDYSHCSSWCWQKLLRQEASVWQEVLALKMDISEWCDVLPEHWTWLNVGTNSWGQHIPDLFLSIIDALLWSEVKEIRSKETEGLLRVCYSHQRCVSINDVTLEGSLVYSHLNLYWDKAQLAQFVFSMYQVLIYETQLVVGWWMDLR